MATQTNQPIPGILIGVTHDRNLAPIIKERRVLKVGIGVPKGRASYVYTHQGSWIVRYGAWESGDKPKLVMKSMKFDNRVACETWYNANKASFAVSNRPQKIPFFTFTRRTIVEIGNKAEEIFDPDFDTIEAHGDTPREIDIVFMGDNPLSGEYQAWSATELKCHGDGLNAWRLIDLGNDKWPGWAEAKAAGEKRFIVSECFESGVCPYAQDGGKDKLACKPSAVLTFQLANSIRLGATAYFTTTSFRSVQQLFSSFSIIQSIAERAGSSIANAPLKMVLAPFRTNHNGMAATQYGVSLELRSQDVKRLRELLAESAWKPTEQRRLIAPSEDAVEITAAAMAAEFYPEADAEFEDDEPAETGSESAKAATAAKTEDLKEKIKSKKQSAETAAKPAVTTVPSAAAPEPVKDFVSMSPEGEAVPADFNPWPARLAEAFKDLPQRTFNLCVMRMTGSTDVSKVDKDTYKKVWEEMVKEKEKMDRESGPPVVEGDPGPGDLF